MNIITRIAPSPTGAFHIGTARTALFNYLFAKQNDGQFLLRIEDTDKQRSKKEYELDIIDGFKWLGLSWDKEMVRQSDRLQHHLDAVDQLVKEERAYKKDGAVWFKVPNEEIITFNDLVRGEVSFHSKDIEDFVILRSDGTPIFYLVGVVDDFDMGITHVIRGEDLLSNTPKQILIARALGFTEMTYGHLPLIFNSDHTKLSKRHGATSVTDYRKKGYLPEAMNNFLALLGWHLSEKFQIPNPKSQNKAEEFFTLDELVKEFDLSRVSKSGAIFDIQKLNSINNHYLKLKDDAGLEELLVDYKGKLSDGSFKKAVSVLKNRLNYLSEFQDLAKVFGEIPDYDKSILVFKKSNQDDTLKALDLVLQAINQVDFESMVNLEQMLSEIVSQNNLTNGDVFWGTRVALSGLEKSPSPVEMLWVLGKEESQKRLQKAIEDLKTK